MANSLVPLSYDNRIPTRVLPAPGTPLSKISLLDFVSAAYRIIPKQISRAGSVAALALLIFGKSPSSNILRAASTKVGIGS